MVNRLIRIVIYLSLGWAGSGCILEWPTIEDGPYPCNTQADCADDFNCSSAGICERELTEAGETCGADECTIDGVCIQPGALAPTNACTSCQPSVSKTSYQPLAAGTSCDDGALCTYADQCNGSGVCTGTSVACENSTETCGVQRSCNGTASCTETFPTSNTLCDDTQVCTHTDACNGQGECVGVSYSCQIEGTQCALERPTHSVSVGRAWFLATKVVSPPDLSLGR